MSTLSAVIITLNEERNIKRCIDSLVKIADEIIVVDSNSTDNTRLLCSQYHNLTFVTHDWEGYVRQKNYADSLAHGDMILSIDADECLTEELAQEIAVLKEKPLHNKAYSMNRLMVYCGKMIYHGGWYPEIKIRLFPNGRARWTGKKVHETLQVDKDLEIEHLNGKMLHYSYYTVQEHKTQMEKFAALSAEEKVEAGKKATIFDACIHCVWSFVRNYFIKLGFLDGKLGFTISRINAYYAWCKYMGVVRSQRK